MTCETTRSIGAYLLGAVEYPEWTEIDQHVQHCDACRSEVVQLAGLPGLIGRLPLDDVIGHPAPVAPLTAGRERRKAPRPRTFRLVAAAALVMAVVGTFAGIELSASEKPTGTATSTWSTTYALSGSNPVSHVRGGASLTSESWGTQIWIQVKGIAPGIQCDVVVHARDGRSIAGGSWLSDSTRAFWVPASVPLSRAAIASLDVITPSETLVTMTPREAQAG